MYYYNLELYDSITKVADKVTKQSATKLNNADSDEKSIQAKIEKKRAELERNQKRLRQLKQLR